MKHNRYQVDIVRTSEDLEDVFAIREAVFMVEQGESREECFDENDFCGAVHLLAKSNGVAVGGMRLHIINMADGGTMEWGKMAIAENGRGSIKLFNLLTSFANHVTSAKGCRRVVATINDPRLMRYWKSKGFSETGETPAIYAGEEFRPIHRITIIPVPERVTVRRAIANEPTLMARGFNVETPVTVPPSAIVAKNRHYLEPSVPA